MDNKNSLETILEGVLNLHSETGTEGGWWAFQDSKFITPNTTKYNCKKCGLYWDKKHNPSHSTRQYPASKYFPESCAPTKHEFKLVCPENWDYEGLHYLENGNKLEIYHPKNNKKVWSGIIDLKFYPQFTQELNGFWIHSKQIGTKLNKWGEYFFKNYPAKLIIPNKTKSK